MASIKRIEALADGIAYLNKMHDPSSDAYQLRNPALAKAYSFKHLGEVDNKGRRIFTSFIGGYRFLIQDLEWKCSGQTRAKGYSGKLNPMSNLNDLLKSFNLDNMEDGNIFALLNFLNEALPQDPITSETPLSFFTEDK
jgi:hypothetical protein